MPAYMFQFGTTKRSNNIHSNKPDITCDITPQKYKKGDIYHVNLRV